MEVNEALTPVFEALVQLIPLLFIAVLIDDHKREDVDDTAKIAGFVNLGAASLLFSASLSGAFWGLVRPCLVPLLLAAPGFGVALSLFFFNLLWSRAIEVRSLTRHAARVNAVKDLAVFAPAFMSVAFVCIIAWL